MDRKKCCFKSFSIQLLYKENLFEVMQQIHKIYQHSTEIRSIGQILWLMYSFRFDCFFFFSTSSFFLFLQQFTIVWNTESNQDSSNYIMHIYHIGINSQQNNFVTDIKIMTMKTILFISSWRRYFAFQLSEEVC